MEEKTFAQAAQVAVRFDRTKLKEAINSLSVSSEAEWCVACGAGAASAKLEYPADLVRQAGAQFLDAKALRDFATNAKDLGEQAWCVACGAGAKAGPETRILPEKLSDAQIDALANKLLGAVSVG